MIFKKSAIIWFCCFGMASLVACQSAQEELIPYGEVVSDQDLTGGGSASDKGNVSGRQDAASNQSNSETGSAGISDANGIASESGAGDAQGKVTVPDTSIIVHICGAVRTPGVYSVDAAARYIDAIEVAGGFVPEADTEYLNLAECLSDGMRIYVPTVEETENMSAEGNVFTGGTTPEEDSSGLVNLNTADYNQLITLPGIGASKANAIIAYRDSHGRFTDVTQVMSVEGIKEGVYAKIKDLVCI